MRLAVQYPSQFFFAASFKPEFVADLACHGFLPTALELEGTPRAICLLPKLHKKRCLLFYEDLHVSRSSRKHSRKFTVTVDQCFDECVNNCIEQHGENWLYPPLVAAFRHLFRTGGIRSVHFAMHSIECWQDGKLAAGEIGYSVGAVYTSLSGFTKVNSAGTSQLLATSSLLYLNEFEFWDLGMILEYKSNLGAKAYSRKSFLTQLYRARTKSCRLQCAAARNARDIIDEARAKWSSPSIPAQANESAFQSEETKELDSDSMTRKRKAPKQ